MELRKIGCLISGISLLLPIIVSCRSSCYGEGGGTVGSPLGQEMFVFSGFNNTCITALLRIKTDFKAAKRVCGEEFANEGELVKEENKKYVMVELRRRNVTGDFWVGFKPRQHGNCVFIKADGTLKETNVCDSRKLYICEYPFNYDCVFKNNKSVGYWERHGDVCRFQVWVVWQHSDLDHGKNCTRDKYEIIPMEICTLWSSSQSQFLGDSRNWTNWADSFCSKPCVGGGVKQIFLVLYFRLKNDDTRKNITLNQTLTMSCNTHIRQCPSTITSTRRRRTTNIKLSTLSIADKEHSTLSFLIIIIACLSLAILGIVGGLIFFFIRKSKATKKSAKQGGKIAKNVRSRDTGVRASVKLEKSSKKSAKSKKSVKDSKKSAKGSKKSTKQSKKSAKSKGKPISKPEETPVVPPNAAQYTSFLLPESKSQSSKHDSAPPLSLPALENTSHKKVPAKKRK